MALLVSRVERHYIEVTLPRHGQPLMTGDLIELPATAAASPNAVMRMGNPLDLSPADFRQALSRRSENRRSLIDWIRSSLVEGIDYGSVPLSRGGKSKPSLRKPGAEKICGMLGVVPRFPTLRDYERAALDGRTIEQIILRCEIRNTDDVCLAEGVGARTLKQDYGDLNKALKMCEKSAHINATLRLSGLSEIFTQDLEDMAPGIVDDFDGDDARIPHDPPAATTMVSAGNDRAASTNRVGQKVGGDRFATQKQVRLVQMRLDQAGIPERDLLTRYDIASIEELPFANVNDVLTWINSVTGQS